MCSIIGGYNINHINTDYNDFINNSFELMRHRGPDCENITRINNYLTFGHQRLSIIDLSSKSNQPIINKNLFLTYNGEIFNYKNLHKIYFKKSSKSISDSLLLSINNVLNNLFHLKFLITFCVSIFSWIRTTY